MNAKKRPGRAVRAAYRIKSGLITSKVFPKAPYYIVIFYGDDNIYVEYPALDERVKNPFWDSANEFLNAGPHKDWVSMPDPDKDIYVLAAQATVTGSSEPVEVEHLDVYDHRRVTAALLQHLGLRVVKRPDLHESEMFKVEAR